MLPEERTEDEHLILMRAAQEPPTPCLIFREATHTFRVCVVGLLFYHLAGRRAYLRVLAANIAARGAGEFDSPPRLPASW